MACGDFLFGEKRIVICLCADVGGGGPYLQTDAASLLHEGTGGLVPVGEVRLVDGERHLAGLSPGDGHPLEGAQLMAGMLHLGVGIGSIELHHLVAIAGPRDR